jgi:hypothetical protein
MARDSPREQNDCMFQGGKTTASMIPASAACYSCHASQGAADSTFVQYYPTLLPVAKSKGALSAAYVQKSESAPGTAK